MKWRSSCQRELRIVHYCDNITMQASGVHSHAEENKHCFSMSTLTSIQEAVKHNVTQLKTGCEALKQLGLYLDVMCSTKTSMVCIAHDLELETLLNNAQYFHHLSILNTQWSQHAQWCCTCKDCFRDGIFSHTLMMTLLIAKVDIPDILDEHLLERKESAQSRAKNFHGRMQEKEDASRRDLIFEEQEVVPPRDADGSWSGRGSSHSAQKPKPDLEGEESMSDSEA